MEERGSFPKSFTTENVFLGTALVNGKVLSSARFNTSLSHTQYDSELSQATRVSRKIQQGPSGPLQKTFKEVCFGGYQL